MDEGGLEEVSEVRKEETWVSMQKVPVNKLSVEGVSVEGVSVEGVSVEGVSVERVAGEVLVVGVEVLLSEKRVKA